MTNKHPQINKEMMIDEIITILPESQDLMRMAGLHCVGCFASKLENLEQGMRGHGYSEREIDEFVKELNLALEEQG